MAKDQPHYDQSPEAPANLKLWNSVSAVDRKFTKPITGKSYKGDSPNPTYVIRKITEQLGPIGQKWGFRVVRESVIEGKPHQIVIHQRQEFAPDGTTILTKEVGYQLVFEKYHQVEIEFWQRDDQGHRTFSAYGGTPMLYLSRKGEWQMDEDAAKKSLTDAYTKAASWLGVCADIFLGLFDDKYTAPKEPSADPRDNPDAKAGPDTTDPAAGKASTPPANRQSSAPEGW